MEEIIVSGDFLESKYDDFSLYVPYENVKKNAIAFVHDKTNEDRYEDKWYVGQIISCDYSVGAQAYDLNGDYKGKFVPSEGDCFCVGIDIISEMNMIPKLCIVDHC